jgi:Flp pilus assembly protein TadD
MRLPGHFMIATVVLLSSVTISLQDVKAADEKTFSALEAPAGSAGTGHNSEGIKMYMQGKWEDAEMHFDEAIKADPKMAEAHYNSGLALDKMGKHKEATDQFAEALKLAPNNRSIAESPILKAHLERMKKN